MGVRNICYTLHRREQPPAYTESPQSYYLPELGEELRSTTTTPTAVDDSEDESYIP